MVTVTDAVFVSVGPSRSLSGGRVQCVRGWRLVCGDGRGVGSVCVGIKLLSTMESAAHLDIH